MSNLLMRDDDGIAVRAGDWITFSYGIPPVRVDAKVSTQKGRLVFTVLGPHRPRQGELLSLRRHVGSWYKSDGPGALKEATP
jgi:hypothetical protein